MEKSGETFEFFATSDTKQGYCGKNATPVWLRTAMIKGKNAEEAEMRGGCRRPYGMSGGCCNASNQRDCVRADNCNCGRDANRYPVPAAGAATAGHAADQARAAKGALRLHITADHISHPGH